MLIDRWSRIEQLYAEAMERDAAERAAFLDRACVGDEDLRDELESLLAYASQTGKFIDLPLLNVAEDILTSEDRENSLLRSRPLIGESLGAYRIVSKVGTGGMGEVFRAVRDDDVYQKNVAIKLVGASVRSPYFINRFKTERQILANLDHSNIARLYDGGTTTDGIPYLVMEYVEGEPVTRYCNRRRLSITERLRLFLQVCSAVQYAHQHLIIHRDIKPDNILVTSDGVAKLMDFGIAKILDTAADPDPSTPTITSLRAFTPAYASPEQVKGDAITTASDVYSLGVVLYEMLTQRAPYRFTNRSAHEVARAICEAEPMKPSTAITVREKSTRESDEIELDEDKRSRERTRKMLRGDLDNILLMALRKEPGSRYGSVEQFKDDIQRHLNQQPIMARRNTIRYRASKFVSRHKVGVAGGAVAAALLTVGISGVLYEAHVAQLERARAEARFDQVRKIAHSLMFEIHDSIRDLPGSTPARKLLVDEGLQYLDVLAKDAGDNPKLQRELAAAYERMGDVQGYTYRSNLGDTADAMESYEKALDLREILASANPNDAVAKEELAGSYQKVADSLRSRGLTAEALTRAQQALVIRTKLAAANPKSESARYSLASCELLIGDVQTELPDWPGALRSFQTGFSIFQSLAQKHPNLVSYRRMVSVSFSKIGFVYENTGRLPDALRQYRAAAVVLKPLAAASPSNTLLQRNLAIVDLDVGDMLVKLGNAEGLKMLRQAAMVSELLASKDAADKRSDRDLGLIYGSLADAESKFGSSKRALKYYEQAVKRTKDRVLADPQNVDGQEFLAEAYQHLGEFYESMGSRVHLEKSRAALCQRARQNLQNGLNVWLNIKEPISNRGKQDLAELHRDLADCDSHLQKATHPDHAHI